MWKHLSPYLFKYRWKIAAVSAAAFILAVIFFVPPLRAKASGLKDLLLGTESSPVTIVTDQGIADELGERVAQLEAEVTAAKQARLADTELIKQLQADYQAAIKEVAETHDAVLKEAASLSAASKQVSNGTSPVKASETQEQATGGKVSLNRGTVSQLDSLPGIGPAYAQRIIDYRTEHGPFKSIDDLDEVSGIGQATIEKIRDLVEL